MDDTTIKVLDMQKCRIVKNIAVKKNVNGEPFFGMIRYARLFSDIYKMTPKDKTKFDRCLNGYDEDEFPNDELDDIINETVQQYFDELQPKTELCILSSDIKNYRIYTRNRKKMLLEIRIPSECIINNAIAHLRIPIELWYLPQKNDYGIATFLIYSKQLNKNDYNLLLQKLSTYSVFSSLK